MNHKIKLKRCTKNTHVSHVEFEISNLLEAHVGLQNTGCFDSTVFRIGGTKFEGRVLLRFEDNELGSAHIIPTLAISNCEEGESVTIRHKIWLSDSNERVDTTCRVGGKLPL